jgi:acyl carrier protein
VSQVSAERIRALILSECAGSLALFGNTAESVPDDFDLRAHGVIDSLGFLELVVALESVLGCELDFEALEPEHLTVIGPLSRYVAAQAAVALATTNGAVVPAPEPA